VRSPHRHEPNATRLGSNETLNERDITICSNRQTGKKKWADCTVRTDADVACPYDDVVEMDW
jgi:hypothetical protein